jgi:DNA-binding NarL/FixJ family response regulator
MLSLIASSILVLAASALAIGAWRQRQAAEVAKRELKGQRAELERLIAHARQESGRLETAIASARAVRTAVPRDTLAAIEGLGDTAALDNPRALDQVAAQISQLPVGVAGDLFDADQRSLAIARLIDQGHSTAEIARRVGLPIGEVELRLSLRS